MPLSTIAHLGHFYSSTSKILFVKRERMEEALTNLEGGTPFLRRAYSMRKLLPESEGPTTIIWGMFDFRNPFMGAGSSILFLGLFLTGDFIYSDL